MDVLVVRHAVAHERDPERWPDDAQRPLTPEGDQEFRRLLRLLAPALPEPRAVLTSPLVRARQTAQALHDALDWPEAEVAQVLEPEELPALALRELAARPEDRVAVVGHEPHLSALLALMLSGSMRGVRVNLRKGALALVRFDDRVASGEGELRWLLDPKPLGKVAVLAA